MVIAGTSDSLPVEIGPLGVIDDAIMDIKNHGGPDQAVYLYGQPDYDFFAEALGRDGWHEGEFKRDFWYVNLVHFVEPIAHPDELVGFVADRRTAEPADLLIAEIEVAQWRYAETGMLPIKHASVALSLA